MEQEKNQIFEIKEATNYPDGVQMIHFGQDSDCKEPIPIFDIRQPGHHELIAKHYSEYGKMGVVHGVGLYGAVWPVKTGKSEGNAEKNPIERFKPNRSDSDKVPIYLHPKNLSDVIDISKLHKEFRPYFQNEQAVHKLYQAAPAIHLIVPVKENHSGIDPMFITYPDDWKRKGVDEDQHIDLPTISAFYWDDPDHEKVAALTEELLPDGFIAISSFNKHGEDPAWDFPFLLEYIKKYGCPFDYVVYDPLIDNLSVGSSFVQISPPLSDEEPLWKIYRSGPTNIDAFLERAESQHSYRLVKGAKEATRRSDLKGKDLDEKMLEVQRVAYEAHRNRDDTAKNNSPE